MDFDLNDDQRAIQEGIGHLLGGRFTSERVRALIPSGGVERAAWAELVEAGVFDLRHDEGGLGMGVREAAVVFEELGAAMVPGPLVWSELARSHWPARGTDRVVGGVVLDAEGRGVVEHLGSLDELLVIDGDGVRAADPATVTALASTRPLDPLTPVQRIEAVVGGEALGDRQVADQLLAEGSVLTSALLVGLARRGLDLAVAYSLERQQFDRPIGSFQVIKHLLADVAVAVELGRTEVHAAAVHLDDPSLGSPDLAVGAAKVLAGDAALESARTCIQVHGGMGITWEVDAHLLLKRAWTLNAAFGSSSSHALRLFEVLVGEAAAAEPVVVGAAR